MRSYTLTAHTGNENTKDNSLESIRSAAENGADIVEFDLMFRKISGVAVMRHSRPVPFGCPTVEQGFKEVLKTDLKINVDVKDPSHLDKAMELAEKIGVKERCFFTGVEEKWVSAVKKQCPDMTYYLNTNVDGRRATEKDYIDALVKKVKDSGAVGINCHYGAMNGEIVSAFHSAGLQVSVWTVNNLEDYRKIAAMGVDNITTRFPSFEKQK